MSELDVDYGKCDSFGDPLFLHGVCCVPSEPQEDVGDGVVCEQLDDVMGSHVTYFVMKCTRSVVNNLSCLCA